MDRLPARIRIMTVINTVMTNAMVTAAVNGMFPTRIQYTIHGMNPTTMPTRSPFRW